jgi:ABC-type multidrug transport system fused ATPase/permease subunit
MQQPMHSQMPSTPSNSSAAKVMVRVLMDFARERPWLVAAAVATLFVMPIQDVMLPHLTGAAVNSLQKMRKTASGGSASSSSKVSFSAAPFVKLGIAAVALQTSFALAELIEARMYPALATHVRQRALRCILEAHDGRGTTVYEPPTGAVGAAIFKLTTAVAFWFDALKSLTPHLLAYVGISTYLTIMDRRVGLGAWALVALVVGAAVFSLRACANTSMTRDTQHMRVHEAIDDTLRNLPAVFCIPGGALRERSRVAHEEAINDDLFARTIHCSLRVRAVTVPCAVAFLALTLTRCVHQMRQGKMDAGTFVAIFVTVLYLMNSLLRTSQTVKGMVYHWGAVRTSMPMLCAKQPQPQPQDPPKDPSHFNAQAEGRNTPPPSQCPGMLPDTGFGLWNVRAPPALKGPVSMHFRFGERTSVVGDVGAGKSTVLRLLAWLSEPVTARTVQPMELDTNVDACSVGESGTLYMDGFPYSLLGRDVVRRAVAYVPQQPHLFDRTLVENALYGNEHHAGEADVWETARQLGVDGWLRSLSHGIHTPVGKGGAALSGGQRQIVWLMRALISKPRVLLLDEPTASLDAVSRTAVIAALMRVPTAVIVTHDPDFAKAVSHRIIRLQSGK